MNVTSFNCLSKQNGYANHHHVVNRFVERNLARDEGEVAASDERLVCMQAAERWDCKSS